MRIAVVSDIHGNPVALDAVLAELEERPVDHVVCLGDVATSGPQPREVLRRLRELGWPVIAGNTDSWLLDPKPYPGASEFYQTINALHYWTAEQITDQDREFIRSFQDRVEIKLDDDTSLLAFHGSPRASNDWITVQTPDEDLEQMVSVTPAMVLAGGHTHQQMLRHFRSKMLINPGSVGLAYEQVTPVVGNRNVPWAEYARLDWQDGCLGIEMRRIPYDLDALLEIARQSTMPRLEWWLSQWRRN